MRRFKDPVVILGGGLSALGVARDLGRRGIDIYFILDQKDTVIYTKYCKKSFVAPGITGNKEVLKNTLRKIGRRLSGHIVVFPVSDLAVLNLAELKNDLSDDFRCVVGDKESVEVLVKKSKFYKALARNGIDHPVTYFPVDIKNAQDISAKITYPVFIKPSISQLLSQVFGIVSKGFVAYSPKELTKYYKLLTRHGIEVMFQEIIPGSPSNSYQLEGYYDINHKPIVLFARQRLRIWPTDFGNATLCVSIPLSEMAEQRKTVNKFIRTIGYQGLMSAEFKKDPRDGILKFLEVNARPWWHFWLSTICGLDIVFLSYLDVIGERIDNNQHSYDVGVKSINILNDYKASLKMFLNGNFNLRQWIHSLRSIKVDAFYARDDLSPFIMSSTTEALQFVKYKIFKLSKIPTLSKSMR